MTKTRLNTRGSRPCISHCKRCPYHDKVTFEHTYFDNSIGMIMSKESGRELLSCTPTVFIQGLN